MNPAPRRRIEANADISRGLGQIRQAYHLHAHNQLGPDRIPTVWTDLHRNHYCYGWRVYVAQSAEPGWLPPTISTIDDPRDFVPFLRQQLTADELAFALFTVFRSHKVWMRTNARAEVKRRYNALRGNIGDYSEDDLMFELGPDVFRSTPALRTLNGLLNPRDNAALRLNPTVVFRAVRAEMLVRHQLPVGPPSVTPADVYNAALRLRPRAANGPETPTPAPQVGLGQAAAIAAAEDAAQAQIQSQLRAEAEAEEEGQEGGEADQQDSDFVAPSSPSDVDSPSRLSGRKRKANGGPGPSPAFRRRRISQALEDEEDDDELTPAPEARTFEQQHHEDEREEEQEDEEDPESGRREPEPDNRAQSLSPPFDDPNFPSPRHRARTPSIPPFSPLADTPKTPLPAPAPAQPARSDATSSPAEFRTPPQGPIVLPAEIRPVLRSELERWQEIVRLAQAMPDPRGSRLWVENVRTAVQALRPVGIWVEEMLDEQAMRDDETP